MDEATSKVEEDHDAGGDGGIDGVGADGCKIAMSESFFYISFSIILHLFRHFHHER